ncbi:6-pyruvoyl tetrahydropterin synthase family protein, partial [Candidatus Sumerlaeota bacterium]|nr:6-pyruvoyl tetrahydropterin synthase family protein [Candidatus Sumerlaeota bacterium]
RLAFTLESAHRLPNAGSDHKCSRLHGHSFRIEVGASDLDRLRGPLRGIYDRLDHRYLNEIEGLENPTSENLACWIWRELERDVPRRTGQTGQMGRTGRRGQTGQTVVVVRESPETACVYRGE